MTTKYSVKLAANFRLSKYIVGFIIVAFISILPEALISINSALAGVPEFGLGTLFGSNTADLTLIFAILIIYHGRGIKIESAILKNIHYYPFFLLLPVALGLDGRFSRAEGIALIIIGLIFLLDSFLKTARLARPAPIMATAARGIIKTYSNCCSLWLSYCSVRISP